MIPRLQGVRSTAVSGLHATARDDDPKTVVLIQDKRMYLWHAGGREGEILDTLVQLWTNMAAALRLLRKLPTKQGYAPEVLMTDKLRSCAGARRELGLAARRE